MCKKEALAKFDIREKILLYSSRSSEMERYIKLHIFDAKHYYAPSLIILKLLQVT